MSRSATASLAALGVNPASELTSTTTDHATGRVLPVRGELADLLPWGGLRRGSTVSVGGSTSLLLALLAGATTDGCWAAVVGLPQVGVLAAAELGISVQRLALIPRPGSDPGPVIAALLDGIDLVAVACPLPPSLARRLTARARQRRAVLIAFGSWPSADVELTAESVSWNPLRDGAETLRSQQITVRSGGRGSAARAKHVLLTFGPQEAAAEIELPLVAGGPARSDEPADAGPDRAVEPATRRADSEGSAARADGVSGGPAGDELAARRVEAVERLVRRAAAESPAVREAGSAARASRSGDDLSAVRAGGAIRPGGEPSVVRAAGQVTGTALSGGDPSAVQAGEPDEGRGCVSSGQPGVRAGGGAGQPGNRATGGVRSVAEAAGAPLAMLAQGSPPAWDPPDSILPAGTDSFRAANADREHPA